MYFSYTLMLKHEFSVINENAYICYYKMRARVCVCVKEEIVLKTFFKVQKVLKYWPVEQDKTSNK